MPTTNNFPPCPFCKSHDYEGGGGSWGGSFSTTYFQCRQCKASALDLSTGWISYLIFNTESTKEVTEQWLNSTVLVVLRDWRERFDKEKHEAWLAFLPAFLERHGVVEVEPGCIRYSALPTQAAKDEVDAFNANEKSPDFLPHLKKTPLLPLIPQTSPLDQVVVFRRVGEEWRIQDAETSGHLECPPDPITVRNAEFWNSVFQELEIPAEEVRAVPNQYHGEANEPWFQFTIADTVFTVGWRKRVINLHFQFPEPRDISAVRDFSKRDNTTFGVDDSWNYEKEGPLLAKGALIHAWGKAKCFEYLRTMIAIATSKSEIEICA